MVVMQLQDQLYQLYIAQIYPVLSNNDPVYQQSLFRAGLGWNPAAIPDAHRASFEQEMKMQAWLAQERVEGAKSLAADSIRVKRVDGRMILYRVADSGVPFGNPGIWWFTEKVAERCRAEAGPDPAKRLDWLREVLAVCFNWSKFDRIERFTLHAGETIPAILGRGLPMPHYKVDPYVDRKTGERLMPKLPPDYWKRKSEMLLGGELQIVLPWIPAKRVQITDSL
ncbi:MAG: hypothetical protein ABI823_04415 [Bryobacteraceae bacterium]